MTIAKAVDAIFNALPLKDVIELTTLLGLTEGDNVRGAGQAFYAGLLRELATLEVEGDYRVYVDVEVEGDEWAEVEAATLRVREGE
jgi:hypothetical protein